MEPKPGSPKKEEPASPSKKEASWVWQYFERDNEGSTCIKCKKKFSSNTGTSTLSRHLSSTHALGGAQKNLEEAFHLGLSGEEQGKIDEALLWFIIEDFQAYQLVEEPSFVGFVHKLNPRYQIPNRKRISEDIKAKAEKIKEAIKEELQKSASKICLTTDTWTSSAIESYMAITAHFLSKDWKTNHLVIAFPQMTESHTAENLKQKLLEVLHEYAISTKVFLCFLCFL